MASVGTISIDILANVVKLQEGMKKATNTLTGFQRDVKRSTDFVKKAFGLIGIGFAVSQFKQLATSNIEAADAIAKTADAIGISTSEWQRYSFAAQRSGVDTKTMETAIEGAVARIGQARQGTGALVTYLQRYDQALLKNIQTSKSSDEALKLLFNGVGNAKDAMDKAGLAGAAFGLTIGPKLAVMMKGGVDGFNRLKMAADQLGVVIDERTLRNAEEVNDRFGDMSLIIKNQLVTAIVAAAPELIKMSQYLGAIARGAGEFIDSFREIDKQNSLTNLQNKLNALLEARQKSLDRLNGKGGFFSFLIGDNADRANLAKLDAQINAINERMLELQKAASAGAAGKGGKGQFIDALQVQKEVSLLDSFTKSLQLQSSVFGLSTAAALQYRITQGDISQALKDTGHNSDGTREKLLAHAQALQIMQTQAEQTTIAMKANDDALKEGLQIMQSTMTPYESFSQQVMHLNSLWQSGAIDTQTYYRAIGQAQDTLQTSQEQWMRKNHAFAQQFKDEWTNAATGFDRSIGDSVAKAIVEHQKFADVARAAVRSFTEAMISSTVAIMAQRAALWAAEKLGLISTTAAAVPAAAAVSLASGGTNAIGAVAGIAATAAAAKSLVGIAHDGLPDVPQTGTYLLQRGERVVKQSDNKDLSSFLKRGGGTTINVNIYPSAFDARGVSAAIMASVPAVAAAVQSAYDRNGRSGGPIR